jgi:flagellar biosynthesis GTPase FlhF
MSTPGELLEALGREARARFGAGGTTPMRVFRGRSVDELVPQIQRELGADAIIVRRREGLTGGVLGFFQRAYVEIEAMPGAPGVDVYDEEDNPPPATPPPAAEAPAVVAGGAPSDPGAVTQAFGPLDGQPYSPPPARAATPPPVLPQPQPAASYGAPPPAHVDAPAAAAAAAAAQHLQPQPDVEPLAPGPPVAPPPATPFYARDGTLAGAGGGSAYVTAHLAALARADRTKSPPRTAPATLVPTADPAAWRAEFQELSARNAPELFPRASAPARAPRERAREEPSPIERPAEESVPVERAPFERPAPRWAPRERREVAPGSQSRARTGVARSLERCGIGEALTEELIDGASAHALALAPRAGLAQAVRATLAQRIPVAPALPTKGAAIVVVGAGGAGKTTCCAALLGAYRKSSTLPASFATVTREPERGELELVLSPYLMRPSPARAPRALRALRRVRGDGIAVLDTPSVSPSDRGGIRELAKLLAELQPERIVIALPATLGATAAAQLLQALRPLGANAMAVTHVDETDQLGVAVEAACRFALAPEYLLERARGGWRLRQIAPSALAERLLP